MTINQQTNPQILPANSPMLRNQKKKIATIANIDEDTFDREDPMVGKLRIKVRELEKKIRDYEKDLKVEKEKGQILGS
jgi:hypothetical protein